MLGQVEFIQQLHGEDGHKKGYLNNITTKSRVPTRHPDDTHKGAWDTVKRQIGSGGP